MTEVQKTQWIRYDKTPPGAFPEFDASKRSKHFEREKKIAIAAAIALTAIAMTTLAVGVSLMSQNAFTSGIALYASSLVLASFIGACMARAWNAGDTVESLQPHLNYYLMEEVNGN